MTPARPKQRALLAMLLLHREEVVPAAALIEALWGEEPPGTAQTALHGHVSALRKLLGADRIRTRPPGYLAAGLGRRGRRRPVRVAGRAGARARRSGRAVGAACARRSPCGAASRWTGSRLAPILGSLVRPGRGAPPGACWRSASTRSWSSAATTSWCGARAARLGPSVSRAPGRPADARAVPLRPAGRRAARVPQLLREQLAEELGIDPVSGAAAARVAHPAPGRRPGPTAAVSRPRARPDGRCAPVRYARSGELSIAYQVTGDGPSTSCSCPASSRTSRRTGRSRATRGSSTGSARWHA